MKRVASLGLAALLAGCSMAPKYVRPEAPVPASWPVGDAYLAQSEAALPAVSYRDIFTDARLQALVEQALANNRDLRVAAANLAAARAQVRVVRANQFPEVAASASASRDSGTGGKAASTSYSISGGISSFELDLFGRLASATEAQKQTALASEASARTVRLGLVADLANAWAGYGADQELLKLAEATASSAQATVKLTRARLEGGVAPRTDLRQAEQVLSTAEADVAAQKTALAQDRNLIMLLVGAPFDPALLPGDLSEVVASIKALPAGTSSEVLLRRPDVVAAEYRLRSANANIGVARAELFPRITLTGLLGLASDSLAALFTGDAFHTTVGGNASYSIFNAGGARAGVAVSEAQRDAALATYELAIQTAFREVADALARQGTIGDELAAVERRTAAATDTATLVTAQYRGGIASSLDNLDAQRSLYTVQRTLVGERLLLISNRVTLYRVLGGDQAAASPR
ncbi:efflux transporter outer membrane subunit [Novosphingobium flavum]|uniref:Efflux transporter outer membrane subunit n=1 Tax=Novosphingobium flavum TaxID=1778672 RepID=A0A7X1FT03_9SPHN|nr:efflux transporter outer membrane subunit [Novosphingobium flavum]MBC2666423.1 efflux transporter outer membrane subunit [Novosphingobium flavum]